MTKLMICGTKRKMTKQIIDDMNNFLDVTLKSYPDLEIIEGCCPGSPDVLAEEWAKKNKVKCHHFPGNKGNYLYRNIEMIEKADVVFAVYDRFSYGTAQVVANCINLQKHVYVVCPKDWENKKVVDLLIKNRKKNNVEGNTTKTVLNKL